MAARVVFEYVFDEAEMRRGWKLAQRRWRGLDRLVIGFGLLNVALAFLSALVLQPPNAGGWVLLVPAFYLLTMRWVRSRMFAKRLRDTPGFGGPVRWVLAERQVEIEGGGGRHAIPWTMVVNTDRDDNGMVLRLEDRNFLWLPWNGLVEGDRDQALALVTRRMKGPGLSD